MKVRYKIGALLLATMMMSNSGVMCQAATNATDSKDIQLAEECGNNCKDGRMFLDFAETTLTLDISQSTNQLKTATVVGEVRDYETEEVVVDATVFVEDVLSVKTDLNGRFRVDGLPSGTYVWNVFAENCCSAKYVNYPRLFTA